VPVVGTPAGGATVAITAGPVWTNGVVNRSATTSMSFTPKPGFTIKEVGIGVYWMVQNPQNQQWTINKIDFVEQAPAANVNAWNNVTIPFASAGAKVVMVWAHSQDNQGKWHTDTASSAMQIVN